MKWIVDMEAFQVNSEWYPKEIAILNTSTLECKCLMIKCCIPFKNVHPVDMATIKWQFRSHCIYWDSGDYTLEEAKLIITKCVNKDDDVYVKGDQKEKLFQTWFPRVHSIDSPPLRNLNECINEVCDKLHSRNCARRKCFELIPYVPKE